MSQDNKNSSTKKQQLESHKKVTPRVLISRCLGFAPCRFDGSMFRENLIDQLQGFVKFVPVCPEEELGLGTPRKTLRLYESREGHGLYQQDTGSDLTQEMKDFAYDYLSTVDNLQGAILKTRSPSCALKDAKIYAEKTSNITSKRGAGLFSECLLEQWPNLPVEDEGRLKNRIIRENFLTKIFSLARFAEIKSSELVKELIKFHADHKFLFMSYNESVKNELGRLLANQDNYSTKELFSEYETLLYKMFQGENTPGRKVNVLMHIMGFFKDEASSDEKSFLLDTIEKYRENQLPLSVPINIFRSWAIKYEQSYLLSQYFFAPFPEELISLEDSGKSSRPK
ncbi:YbgA family protein [Natranaerobius thermophilus]|uniref:DUF1722 domain-containing protein n=1 Tax=Natranaerobius thermophilus (strain ATCC BAA-1301 / DSM 18059 / JW/NM-WN-LF) TaxID=457570 RepID=B2A7J7_NATTJ|nr:DUF523 and DUF1722 domain-containing protein [Natranaerobius thermophilus]ACB85706.1 Protein of unknown function DUF1722 [Natranaerobius thermophilus JW/NM-WN-LF]